MATREAIEKARDHYTDGMLWLTDRGTHTSAAGGAMAAATAAAYFAAGQLVLAIDAATYGGS